MVDFVGFFVVVVFLGFFCSDNNLSHEWRFKRVTSKHKSQIMVLSLLRSLWEMKSYVFPKLVLSVQFLLRYSNRVGEVD